MNENTGHRNRPKYITTYECDKVECFSIKKKNGFAISGEKAT